MKKKRDVLFPLGDEVRIQVRKVKLTVISLFIVCVTFGNVNSEVRDKPIGQVEKFVVPVSIEQQQTDKTISGKITDATGSLLPGVTVVIKGTTNGTITDGNGNYSLSNVPENGILVFSFVGMKSVEIAVGENTTINVSLAAETTMLDEVVVVGYGTQKKATLTGSIVATKGDELMKSPTNNLANNLAGRLPGLVAVNSGGGQPGNDGASLKIRGSNTFGQSNSPLIVVDGIANRGMQRISPSDIESITILKDASAAIYGAQAANGVILITTKRGQIGKPQVKISRNNGFSQPTILPKMADAGEYATVANELAHYAGQADVYSAEDIRKYKDGSDPWGHPNTNFFDEAMKNWAPQNYTNASVSGGTEKMKYFLSFGYRNQDGNYKRSEEGYKQYDFRTNIDGKISNNIDIAFDAAGRQEDRLYNSWGNWGVWNSFATLKPTLRAYWPDGTPAGGLTPTSGGTSNPMEEISPNAGYNKNTIYNFESNLQANIKIPGIEGLSVQTNASFDKSFNFSKHFKKPYTVYNWDGNPDYITTKGVAGSGGDVISLDQSSGLNQRITINAVANYEKAIDGNNNIKLTLGAERQSGNYSFLSGYRTNYASPEIEELFAGANDTKKDNNGYGSQFARANYFGRANYNYAQKYLCEFVFRYDGSYKFAPGHQFGFFPGVSAGWRISEENFWKDNISFIESFKIRGSWGKTGNDGIADYQYLATYGFFQDSYTIGGEEKLIMTEARIPNPIVTWETAIQENIGFDAQMLDSKLTLSFDYFYNKRSDILTTREASVPTSAGLTLPPENIGEMDNRGFEYVITYSNVKGDFKYTFSTNGSYSKNKILFWDDTPDIPDYQKKIGKPLGSDLYYQAIGVFKDQAAIDAYPHWDGARPGDIIFEDVSKDGQINSEDLVRNDRSADPRFIGGFDIGLQYKNFDLSVLFQGVAGGKDFYLQESGSASNFLKEDIEGRWTVDNIDATKPRAFNWGPDYWARSDYKIKNTYWLRSNDYLRLKNVELGYNLPKHLCDVINTNNIRIYVNGSNLLTWSGVKRTDPELPSNRAYIYPVQRIINTGIAVTF